MANDVKDVYVYPPEPPYRFWCVGEELCRIQAKIDAGATPSSEEWLIYCRLRGRRDLYFFAKHIVGFTWLEWKLHGPLAWAWQRPNGDREKGLTYGRVRMAIIPRGHLKTSLCTQAYAMWRLVCNPEERILIFTHNQTMADDMMNYIRTTFNGGGTHGEFFLACYGDIIPAKSERDKWKVAELTIKRQGNYTDPSIKARGVGSTLTGGHFTLQLVDDIIGEELSREQMKKVIRLYSNLTPMYHSLRLGERRIVGTHWAFFDPYFHVKRYDKNALVAQRTWKENGELIFTKCDVEEALKLKQSDPFFFSCQYENNPRDADKMGFREEWFRYFKHRGDYFHELDRDGKETRKVKIASCNTFVLVDPNTGRAPGLDVNDTNKRREHDYAGIVVVSVGPENIWYIPRIIRARYNPQELVDKIFELVQYWSPKFVAIEQVAAQRLFVHIFNQEWKKGRPMFGLLPWAGGTASKEERIKGLIPHYANGFIYHREGETVQAAEGTAALEGELLDFPNAEFDDASDALSAALPLVYAPGTIKTRDLRVLQRAEADLLALDEGSARAWRVVEKKRQESLFGGSGEFWGADV